MTEPIDPSFAEVTARVVLQNVQKDEAKRKLLTPVPKWPEFVSSLFGLLFIFSLTANPALPFGKWTTFIAFLGFSIFLSRHFKNLSSKLDAITALLNDQSPA